jgi:phosphatidylserine/phosphatidylglycerophosphate/cardiolipin synthase-like enzyme
MVGLKNGQPAFVITGSFNYTEQANTHNLENVVRIDDAGCADAYMREAVAIMTIAKPCKPLRCRVRPKKRRRV